VITNKLTFDPPTRLSELTRNLIRSSHGHSTPSLKISCKSVQPFSRNVADKETKKERKKERNRPKTIPRPTTGGGVIIIWRIVLLGDGGSYLVLLSYTSGQTVDSILSTLRAGDDAVDDGVAAVVEVLEGLRKLATDEDVSVVCVLLVDSFDELHRSLDDVMVASSRSGGRDDACGRCVGSSALRQRRRSRTVADDDNRHAVVSTLNASSSTSPGDTVPGRLLIRGTVSKTAVRCSVPPGTPTCLFLLSSRRSLTLTARLFTGVDITRHLLTDLLTYLYAAADCSCQETSCISFLQQTQHTLYCTTTTTTTTNVIIIIIIIIIKSNNNRSQNSQQ